MHKFFAKTESLGKKVIFLPQCHSTNEEAQKLLKSGDFIVGTTVISQHQTGGKGQRGNSWESEPGRNALFSVILDASFIPIKESFRLHMLTSLALHDTLFPILGKNLKIKWPNDIYYKNQKLSGILIENIIAKRNLEHSVIGIGININQEAFTSPQATSIKEITQLDHEVNEVIEDLLCSLEARIKRLKGHPMDTLRREYERKMYRLGEVAKYTDPEGAFHGTIKGIDPSGKLQIEKDGRTALYDFQEVSFS